MSAGANPRRPGPLVPETLATYRLIPGRSSRRSFGRRALLFVGALVGTIFTFIVSAAAGVVLHLGTPRARRTVAREVSGILAPSFQGRIRIERLGGLGVFGLSGADVTIDDPMGRPVLAVRGVRLSFATLPAARSAILDKHGPLLIRLPYLSLDSADVRLDTDPDGNLDLLDAFAPRSPASGSDSSGRGLRLELPEVALKHAWVHGLMAGAPPLDIELDDFHGAFTLAPEALELDVSKARVVARRLVNGADVDGSLVGHLKKFSDPKVNPDGHVDWQGSIAGIPASFRGSLVRGELEALFDAPQVAPEKVRLLWAGSSLDEPASVHLAAHGALPDVMLDLRATLGAAAVDAKGTAFLGDDKRAKISLSARDVDVRELVGGAPPSRLGLTGDVSAEMKADGVLSGDATLRFLGGTLGSRSLPTASIRASATGRDARDLQGDVDILVDEPGAPTRLIAHLRPNRESSVIDFDLTSPSADLGRIPELEHALRGRANLRIRGALQLGSMTVDADVHAKVDGLSQGTTHVTSATVDAYARGPVASPRIEATLHAQGIDAAGLRLTSADAVASGPAIAPHVVASVRGPDIPEVDASGDLLMGSVVSVGALRATLARAGERAVVTAARVTVAGRVVGVDDARIEGVGEPTTATLALTPGVLRLRAATSGIDLGRLARLAHVEDKLRDGTLSFDADLNLRRDRAEGRLTLDLSRAVVANVKDVSAHVQANLEGRKLVAKAHAQAGAIGSVDLQATNLELGGAGPMALSSWRQAWGVVDVDGQADLTKLSALVPPETLPFGEASGEVTLKGHIRRDNLRDLTPDLTVSIATDKLVLAAKTPKSRDIDGVVVYPPPPWRLAGMDFVVEVQTDGDTGFLAAQAHIRDAKGKLADVSVTAPHFPYRDVFEDSGRLAGDLRTTQFDLKLAIPERGLRSVPPILAQEFVSGKLQADLHVVGTLLVPKADLTATLRRANFGNSMTLPLDLDVGAHYDGKRGSASVKALSGDHEVLDVEAQGEAAIVQFLDVQDSPPAWKASAHAHLDAFPMESIAILDDKLISGALSGDVSVDDLHKDARANVALTVDSFQIGSINYKSAQVSATADGQFVDAAVRIDQTDGFAETKGRAAVTWADALVPKLDASSPLTASLLANNFRIAALLPFLSAALDELDGRLDGSTQIELDPKARAARLSGQLALSRGTIEAVAGGGEFHDVTAILKFAPDGVITLQNLSGKGLTGRFDASGSARLDGPTLQSARAVLVVPANDPLPLVAGGSEMGDVDGRLEISETGTNDGKAIGIEVHAPHLRVALPEESLASVEALRPMDNVRIGSHRGAQEFVLLPLDPIKRAEPPSSKPATILTIQTDLDDVQVLRGTQLKVDLTGRVNIRSAETTVVTGQIRLQPGGVLAVQGRSFSVESGTVTFVGADPSNPEVVVKAGWTAPDGTVVYANFVGPLKTGKVTLSSEPALPQQEIVQLLLFGSPDGQQAQTPSGSTQTNAVGTVGGEAAQPINHALNQAGLGAFTAKVDTSQASTPKPEVEYQIARDISLQLAFVLGQPLPGVNPDRVLLTLDYRFLKKWSLASTLGDAGTTIFDLLWQKRY